MTEANEGKISAEFDDYAQSYGAGMEDPLKAKLGKSAEDFITVKVDWLAAKFPHLVSNPGLSLLDYGCGAGALLRVLRKQGWKTQIEGCDVSQGMLNTARDNWPSDLGDVPPLAVQDGSLTPYAAGSFDFVVISAVLHHVPVDQRDAVICEICRVLKPDGNIVVFEHNPLNPVTRFVVARTPIDRNAILLSAAEKASRLQRQGFPSPSTEYIMFTPPGLPSLRAIDGLLRWCPLGAQYVTFAARPR